MASHQFRDIKDDRRSIGQRIEKGLRQFPVRADPVEQQEWYAISLTMPQRYLKRLALDRDSPNFDAIGGDTCHDRSLSFRRLAVHVDFIK